MKLARVRCSLLCSALAVSLWSGRGLQATEGDRLPGGCVRPGAGPSDPIVYELEGTARVSRQGPGRFGYAMVALDDLDGDGVPEFAAGAAGFPLPDRRTGFVGLYSGRTGARLKFWLPRVGRTYYGNALGVGGDIDGDGFRELAVLHGRAVLDVISPGSGEVLYEVPGPPGDWGGSSVSIVRLGDADGDGIDDWVLSLGAYDNPTLDPEYPTSATGRVAAHSGVDGRLLWERLGEECSLFGFHAEGVGDVSGDGVPDVLVGEPNSLLEQRSPVQSPSARLVVLSGVDGSTVEVHVGEPWQLLLGRGLAFLGDTDQNGRVEVVAAASWAHNGPRVRAGWVGVYELPGFQLRYEIWGEHGRDFSYTPDLLGYYTSEAGDADGDGAMDFLLSTDHMPSLSSGRAYGRLYLHSGRTGELLQVYEGRQSPFTPGVPYFSQLASLGDADGDGRAEFLVGAGGWADDDLLQGYVQVLRYQPELTPFRRGDIDGNGRYTMTDVVRLARVVARVEPAEPCPLVYDVDGSNEVNALDLLNFLYHLFYFDDYVPPEPAPPSLGCGRYARLKPVPREVPLSCREHPGCRD